MSGDSTAEVVQTDSGREVRKSFRQACHEYAMDVALAFFMATTVLGFVILWRRHVPETAYHAAVLLFILYSFAGFGILGIGYRSPVWFYELLEDETDG